MHDYHRLELACYVRSGALSAPTNELVRRVESLTATGRVTEVAVRSWPRKVSLHGSSDEQALATFATFDRWADAQDASICPPFFLRRSESHITGESKAELIMPVVCLAVYSDQALAGVFPHSTSDTTYTPHDVCARLKAGAPLDSISPAIGTPPGDSEDSDPPTRLDLPNPS